MAAKRQPLQLRFFVRGAVIAALYASLAILLSPISYGPIQVRFSEILTVLPFFFPEAIWGLTMGCFVANLASPFGWIDYLFGSLFTLCAGGLTYYLRRTGNPYWGILPPIIINAVGVGLYVSILINEPPSFQWITYAGVALSIGAGQAIAVGGGGSLLIHFIQKYKEKWL